MKLRYVIVVTDAVFCIEIIVLSQSYFHFLQAHILPAHLCQNFAGLFLCHVKLLRHIPFYQFAGKLHTLPFVRGHIPVRDVRIPDILLCQLLSRLSLLIIVNMQIGTEYLIHLKNNKEKTNPEKRVFQVVFQFSSDNGFHNIPPFFLCLRHCPISKQPCRSFSIKIS
jgi:hypothetical protein